MKAYVILVAIFCISSCAQHSNLLDSDQRRASKNEANYVRSYLPNIYSQINKSRTTGALVAVPHDQTTAPQITTSDSVNGALVGTPAESQPSRHLTCYYIYAQEKAAEPLRAPCSNWIDEAKRIDNFDMQIKELRAGQSAIAAVLNPLLSASKLNTGQIELINRQIDVLSRGFDNSVGMQGKTSEALLNTLSKLGENNQELNKKLDELAAKLGSLQ